MAGPRNGAVVKALLCGTLLLPWMGTALPAKVEGRRLVVEGRGPLHMKGVNWNPVARGRTIPAGVSFRESVRRDAWMMSEAGINVIRTYFTLNQTDVLDELWARGIQVINTMWASRDDGNFDDVARQVNMVKNHPAILMWSIGNEWNYNGCYSGMSFSTCAYHISEAAHMVKRHDTTHPVATVYGELPPPDVLSNLAHIDVWGINYYNELSFTTLFDRWALRSPLPMFIAEYGADAYNALIRLPDHGAQALATTVLTQEIIAHSSLQGGVCLGGIIFEFADEWWKDGRGHVDEHDVGGIAPGGGPYPDKTFNEEWWGLVEVDRVPREAYHAYARIQLPAATAFTATANAATELHCTAGGCTRCETFGTFEVEGANGTALAQDAAP